MKSKINSRGQVTIFVILAIVIVSVVLIFIFWRGPDSEFELRKRVGFEGCVQDALAQGIKELSPKSGFTNPESTYSHLGEQVPYLCYTNEYYKTCVVQTPFLKQNFESEMKKLIRERVNTCYENSVNSLKDEGYDVVSGAVDFEVLAEPSVLRVELMAPTRIGSSSFTKFNIEEQNDIYDILMIATSILQYEAGYGDADVSSMMFLYPEFIIDKLKQSDGTTIYVITSKRYGTEFKFASRSLAWPPGYYYG